MVLTSKIKITGHLRLNRLGLLLVAGRKDTHAGEPQGISARGC